MGDRSKSLATDCVNIMNPKYFITLKWPDFQRSFIFPKTDYFEQNKSHSANHNASFTTFKVKIGLLYSSQSMWFLLNFEAEYSNFLKKLWGLILQWKLDQFLLKRCQKKRYERG